MRCSSTCNIVAQGTTPVRRVWVGICFFLRACNQPPRADQMENRHSARNQSMCVLSRPVLPPAYVRGLKPYDLSAVLGGSTTTFDRQMVGGSRIIQMPRLQSVTWIRLFRRSLQAVLKKSDEHAGPPWQFV